MTNLLSLTTLGSPTPIVNTIKAALAGSRKGRCPAPVNGHICMTQLEKRKGWVIVGLLSCVYSYACVRVLRARVHVAPREDALSVTVYRITPA